MKVYYLDHCDMEFEVCLRIFMKGDHSITSIEIG